MNKNILIAIIAVVAVVIIAIAVFFLYQQSAALPESGIVLFSNAVCPHCQNVAKYIQDNGVEKKINFKKVEIGDDQEAINSLIEKAKACNLDTSNISIPFLWDGTNCIQGETEIVNFFDLKMRALVQ
ncbi:MAG: glutaredoxin domain-containing protein [Candidatus Staskawiczbacteria bacterium]|jgi:glutaredoxin